MHFRESKPSCPVINQISAGLALACTVLAIELVATHARNAFIDDEILRIIQLTSACVTDELAADKGEEVVGDFEGILYLVQVYL